MSAADLALEVPLPASSGETSNSPKGGLLAPLSFLRSEIERSLLSKTQGSGFSLLLPSQDPTVQMVASLRQSLLVCQCGPASPSWGNWGPLSWLLT